MAAASVVSDSRPQSIPPMDGRLLISSKTVPNLMVSALQPRFCPYSCKTMAAAPYIGDDCIL